MYSYPSRVRPPPPPPPLLSRSVFPSRRPRVGLSGGSGSSSSRRTKSSFFSSSSKSSPRASRPMKVDNLQTVKRELTQIKRQVDCLLESLEQMENSRKKSETRSSTAEPGEVSPLPSSPSGKKEGALKRDESRDLNDSEDEGDLLEDDDDEGEEHEEGEDDGESTTGDES